MSKKTTAIAIGSAFGLLVMLGCSTATKPAGKWESRPKTEAEMILYLKADGTLIRFEGMRGGNFEQETVLSTKPGGLGKKLADIQIWEHDGSFNDITTDASPTGPTAHAHSGVVTPPLNGHCHRYVLVDSQWLVGHCP